MERILPEDPLAFIVRCLREGQIFWTYHVRMRLDVRSLSRDELLGAVESLEVIEEYPEDKYLPSYLLYGHSSTRVFHVLIATDVPANNVPVVTAYEPDPEEWEEDFKRRKSP